MQVEAVDAEAIFTLVRRESGIALDTSKSYLLGARLAPVLRANGLASLNELVRLMSAPAGAALRTLVVEALTTNETSFFRDGAPYEHFKANVIPALIAARASRKTLNIWSAASSTGQEIYSIAMLLLDHFPVLAGWKLNLIATDLSEQVLERARQGIYSAFDVERGLTPAQRQKYFEFTNNRWQLVERVRNMVQFRGLNLTREWTGMPQMDVIFLRNVLIYFELDVKQGVLARMRRSLAADGYLFLGSSETTLNVDEKLKRVGVSNSCCYAHEAAQLSSSRLEVTNPSGSVPSQRGGSPLAVQIEPALSGAYPKTLPNIVVDKFNVHSHTGLGAKKPG